MLITRTRLSKPLLASLIALASQTLVVNSLAWAQADDDEATYADDAGITDESLNDEIGDAGEAPVDDAMAAPDEELSNDAALKHEAAPTKAPKAKVAEPKAVHKKVATNKNAVKGNDFNRSIQNALIKSGHKVTADGVFGRQTVAALKAFQKQNGLKVTGKADTETLKKLGLKS